MQKHLTQKQIDDYDKIKLRIDKYAILLKAFYGKDFNYYDDNKQEFITSQIDKLCLL